MPDQLVPRIQSIMLSEGEILINKVAQDKLSLADGLVWFRNCDPAEHRSILGWIRLYLEQAHPDQELIDNAVDKIPLNPTMTPVILFKTYPYKIAAGKVCDLRDNELEMSYITLLTLFKHADKNRRDIFSKDGCSHEWHNLDK